MLRTIAAESVSELFRDIPAEFRCRRLRLPPPLSEAELVHRSERLAETNRRFRDAGRFLGAGCYDHWIPAAVWALAGRAEFLTAYTPYQAEASQGTLAALFEYQTMICELTGLEVSNASLYDGASALAEAAWMAIRHTERPRVLVSRSVHPHYREVLRTYLDDAVKEIPLRDGATDAAELAAMLEKDAGRIAAVLLQQPNFFGILEDLEAVEAGAHRAGALFILSCNPVSLAVLRSPGEWNADIACGEGQPLGCPMAAGGWGFGFLACRRELLRRMPGRLVGMAKDGRGRRGFVLTLQAREQHIRREKATSNICTSQALNAIAAAIHLSLLGPDGLQAVANLCMAAARDLRRRLLKTPGVKPLFSDRPFFHEFCLSDPKGRLKNAGLALEDFYPEMKGSRLFCATEKYFLDRPLSFRG